MFNLIMKDMKIIFNKKTLLLYIIYFIVYSYIFNDNYMKGIDVIFFVFSILIMATILGTFMEDEKYKWDTIINSIPVKKSKVIFARYLSVFVYIVICLVALGIMVLFLEIFNFGNIKLFTIRNLKNMLSTISIVLVFTAIAFPLYYKFGSRSKNLVTIFISAIMGIISFLVSIRCEISIITIQIISLISLCIFIISLLISITIYVNKDME